jgi:hypothetical protein
MQGRALTPGIFVNRLLTGPTTYCPCCTRGWGKRKIEMTKDKRVHKIICRLNYLTWLLEKLAA